MLIFVFTIVGVGGPKHLRYNYISEVYNNFVCLGPGYKLQRESPKGLILGSNDKFIAR